MPRKLLDPNSLVAAPTVQDIRRALVDMWYLVGETPINLTTETTYTTTSKIAIERIIAENTAALTISLNATPNDGDEVWIKRASTGAVTVDGNGNTIDGETTYILALVDDFIKFIYNEADEEWSVMGASLGDFGLEVSKGNVTGHKSVNKFGRNPEIDSTVTADIWSGGQTLASGGSSLIWVAPTQARTHTIASTNANDTDGGSGARTVKIFGLTDWDTAEVNETVTMNTASPPVTSNSYVIIHRMLVVTSGGTNVNAGLITATATTDGTVTARIEIDAGQTEMAIYGIPSTQTLYITEIGSSTNKAAGASGNIDLDLLVNQEPDNQLTAFRHNHHFGLQTAGSSSERVQFNPPKTIAGAAIVKLQGVSGAANMDVGAWFNGYLVNN